MGQRDLANYLDSSVSQIVNMGAAEQKEKVRQIIPADLYAMYDKRTFWIHDMEFYSLAYNCIGVNPSHLLAGKRAGTFERACRELFRSLVALTNQQSGGIGLIDFDSDMAQYIHEESGQEIEESLWQLLQDLNMYVRKGCERAYVTLNFGLCTEEKGRLVTCALLSAYSRDQFVFPNLVFKVKRGVNQFPGDPNYDLYQLSAAVTASCMNPTYLNVDASFNSSIPAQEQGIMGCRTRIAANLFHKGSALNRGNVAAVTVNLVQLALESRNNRDLFEQKLLFTMDRAKELLLHRFEALTYLGNFDYVRRNRLYLDCEQKEAEDMLKNGTLSIGFIGLWDAVSVLYDVDTAQPDVLRKYHKDALQIVELMRRKADSYIKEEQMNFSLLASSAEGVSGYFAQHDSEYYPNAKAVCQKGYYTNSFHIPVQTALSCFEKIEMEAPFHKLCNGGHITYVELAEMPFGNGEAIQELVDYACEHDIGYFGINFPVDVCNTCGGRGSFTDTCPYCGGMNIKRLRRVSGYLSDINSFAFGKKNELVKRKSHTGIATL